MDLLSFTDSEVGRAKFASRLADDSNLKQEIIALIQGNRVICSRVVFLKYPRWRKYQPIPVGFILKEEFFHSPVISKWLVLIVKIW